MALSRQLITAAFGLVLCLTMNIAAAEVVVVISARNPQLTLTSGELADIFQGRRSRFPNGEPVVPVDQEEGSPARLEFYDVYLGRTPAQIKAYWAKLIFTGRGRPPLSVAGDAAAAEYIAENPDAISYIDDSRVDERLRIVQIE